jgi:hypothetical protein
MITSPILRPRRGMTVVAILICLVVVTLVSGAVLKVGLAHKAGVRAQERRLQAEWLANSGLARAFARLAVDRDYAGEVWSIAAADLGLAQGPSSSAAAKSDQAAARVTIIVDRAAPGAKSRRLRVQADYPADEPGRSRHSRELLIDLEKKKSGVKP